jgi:hypothetical protein
LSRSAGAESLECYQQLFGGSANLKLTFLILIAVVIGFMGTCKPKEKCPAYGKYYSKNANHHRTLRIYKYQLKNLFPHKAGFLFFLPARPLVIFF